MDEKRYNRLKFILAEKEKTGRELGKDLGVSELTVSRWVRNARQPDLETLFQIANVLGVDVCELLAVEKQTDDGVAASAKNVSGLVLVLLEVDKLQPENIWLVDLFENIEEMVLAMNGRGYHFPMASEIEDALTNGGRANLDGVNGKRWVVFRKKK